MLLLGIDMGTSSVKVSVVDAQSQKCVASAFFPETEAEIISLQPGWAEQRPDQWWEHTKQAIVKCHAGGKYDPMDIGAVGIAYQMHGLVLVDKNGQVLRNAIIWCDSRAVAIGNTAFDQIGNENCLHRLLNSPGNFTASKLAWVKQQEPELYSRIGKIMLPGDFIAMQMTGEQTTTVSALSEGIFWDFQQNELATAVLDHFGFDKNIFPAISPVCSIHGHLHQKAASLLQLNAGIPVAYKAGDQLNNALCLDVLEPGHVAATAGTSGVLYGVSDRLCYDKESRINSFAHINHRPFHNRIGVLLCINGTGIFNKWIKNLTGSQYSYEMLNEAAAEIPAGSQGLLALPFGNGAERMLGNIITGSHFANIDFNTHGSAHMIRAVQEGIVYAFRYGLDIMRENGIQPTVIRASRTNMFQSNVFAQAFADVNDVAVEFYEGDGSYAAALGAGIGSGIYADAATAMAGRKPTGRLEPQAGNSYHGFYQEWKTVLQQVMKRGSKIKELA